MATNPLSDISTIDDAAQLIAQFEEATKSHIHAALVALHTCTPGIVVSCDGNRASVQPVLRSVMIDGTAVALPLIVDAPIMFPGGGGFVLTFPVKAGDECVIHFAERSIELWQKYGGQQTPEFRLHDLGDGFIQVGVNSDPNQYQNVSTTRTELRTRDATTVIALEHGIITVTGAQIKLVGDVTIIGTLTEAAPPAP